MILKRLNFRIFSDIKFPPFDTHILIWNLQTSTKFTENPNAPDPLGRTPLRIATQKKHHEVVQVLLQALLEKYPSNPQAICNNLAI